ncbi:MAG: DUF2283 domain-containing protein [Candidatus Omnitrophica bacterium]|nr:DUF2283 domain-containing protein [Candidatus Omnitrophota bacterium]MBU0878362.1 DUF2283 domain-containing protein [Candidatus Omnitrophota bacterium]MBU1134485.1 DUF2283 domain-containing protein [Candidatus Omnitrophota bacterium]
MAETTLIEEIQEKTQFNFDSQNDVLYINFGKPQPADDSDITDEGIIVRLREGKIVGLTILNAKKNLLFQ